MFLYCTRSACCLWFMVDAEGLIKKPDQKNISKCSETENVDSLYIYLFFFLRIVEYSTNFIETEQNTVFYTYILCCRGVDFFFFLFKLVQVFSCYLYAVICIFLGQRVCKVP
jgi:hypothetical protein